MTVPKHQRDVLGTIVLLMSDGAWTPLGMYPLKKVLRSTMGRHFSEVPQAVLEAAGKTRIAGDMTVLALRLAR